jgi:hypothetical protein
MDTSWADPTGRRNTLDYIYFEQPVECLCGRLPAECFAWSRIQGVCHSAQFFAAMPTEVCALWKVLTKQTVGIFGAAALPRTLWIAEAYVETSVDPKLGALCHLDTLIPSQGTAQMCRKVHNGFGDGATDGFGPMTCQRWTVLD